MKRRAQAQVRTPQQLPVAPTRRSPRHLVIALATAVALTFAGFAVAIPTLAADQLPLRTIVGASTQLDEPAFATVAPDGSIYVSNIREGAENNGVLVFLPGADGDTAPSRFIAGPNTGFSRPSGLAVDPDTGELFVADLETATISVFASDADGDTAPLRTIAGPNTGLGGIPGIALHDGELYVLSVNELNPEEIVQEVLVFPADASGDVAPTRAISGESTGLSVPLDLSVSATGEVYVANLLPGVIPNLPDSPEALPDGYSVTVYAAGADGDIAPIRTISGGNTGLSLADGIEVDPNGNVYVLNLVNLALGDTVEVVNTLLPQTAPNLVAALADPAPVEEDFGASIAVFSAGSDGNVAPYQTISGASTGLDGAIGLDLDSEGRIYTANNGGNSVTVYAGLPGAPTNLDATAGFSSAIITFTPGQNGGSPIVGYEFSVDGGQTWVPSDGYACIDVACEVSVSGLPNGVTSLVQLRALNSDLAGNPSEPVGVTPAGSLFVAIDPVRAYDSRDIGAGGPIPGGETRGFYLSSAGVPEEAVAVAYNLTITGTSGTGYLTVTPGDQIDVTTSTLNWTASGQTIANGFVTGLDAGLVAVHAVGGSTQFIFDVVGYYLPEQTPVARQQAADGWFTPTTPVRAYDSRDVGAGGPLPGGESRTVNVTAAGAVPPDASAIAYTVTITGTQESGYLTVGPAGLPEPDTSTINWIAPQTTIANSTAVAITEGAVDVFAGGTGSSDFTIDVLGYFSADTGGLLFTPVEPVRTYDSRSDEPGGPLAGGQSRTTSMAGAGIPADVGAVAFNLTVTGTEASGYLTSTPGGSLAPPVASTINWTAPGTTRANGTVVGVASADELPDASTAFVGGGSTQYLTDVAGYYNRIER